MNWLQKLLTPEVVTKEVVKYRIVELPEARTHLKGGDKDSREVIQTLSAHAGFILLIDRLAAMNAALRTKLAFEHHKDMREVDFIQAGIYWSNWLKQECDRATTKMPERQIDAMEEELAAFREIDAALERVG